MWSLHLALQLLTVALPVYSFPGTIITRAASLQSSYDYVIIGGGTSGLTVANRLTENERVNVLVIESGQIVNDDQEFKDFLTPAHPGQLGASQEKYMWPGTISEPNANLNGRRTRIMAARLVGGATAINAMIFGRGSKRDYDDWARLLGAPEWGFDGLLKYFKKSETFTPPDKELAKKYGITWDMGAHGTSGPVHAAYPPYIYESVKPFIEAEKALGVPQTKEQGYGSLGGTWCPNSLNPNGNVRSYAKTGHYDPNKERPNLHLLTDNTVTKILFKGKEAVGVEYAAGPDAEKKTVKADKEVIVASGAVKTPHLLQLSGIGDSRLLKSLKVPVIADLPGVGNNLQDHAGIRLGYTFNYPAEELAWAAATNKTFIEEQYQLYLKNRTGLYTTTFQNRGLFLSLPFLTKDYRSLLRKFSSLQPKSHLREGLPGSLIDNYKKQAEILLASFATDDTAVDENLRGAVAQILRPLSRGYIEANTTSIWDPPKFDWRTYSHPLDLEIVLAGVRWARKFLAAPEWGSLKPTETAPGLNVQDDEGLKAYIREKGDPSYVHPCCTAAMGLVLDGKLRVLGGVKNLRIVDASTFPLLPGHHTQATAYAVAEKAADIIKETW